MGIGATNDDYRDDILTSLKRIAFGPTWDDDTSRVPRNGIIRITGADEQLETEVGPYDYLDRLVRQHFYNSANPGDSLPAITVQNGGTHNLAHFNAVATPQEVTVEIGYDFDYNVTPSRPTILPARRRVARTDIDDA